MNDLHTRRKDATEALLSVLDEITTELERGDDADDVDWLRPLLVLHAEIEFIARPARRLDAAALARDCDALRALLAGGSFGEEEFAARYARARHASPHVRALDERALHACHALLAATSLRWEPWWERASQACAE